MWGAYRTSSQLQKFLLQTRGYHWYTHHYYSTGSVHKLRILLVDTRRIIANIIAFSSVYFYIALQIAWVAQPVQFKWAKQVGYSWPQQRNLVSLNPNSWIVAESQA